MASISQKTKQNVGFTLLELLVAIAIIGMLAAISVINITKIKMKSRDAKRMSDVREIAKALNLYQNQARAYPVYSGTITGTDVMSATLQNQGTITQTPVDPLYPASKYTYQSDDGAGFAITFCLETDSIPNYSAGCGNTISP